MHNTSIDIDRITMNIARKFRASDDVEAVEDYAEKLKAGVELPRVDVFRIPDTNPQEYVLADGDKRFRAAIKNKAKEIAVTVQDGGLREAHLFATQANTTHGARRTRADARRAVKFLLEDEEWSRKSYRQIAEQAKVSHHLVSEVAQSLQGKETPVEANGQPVPEAPKTRVGKDGRSRPVKPPKPGGVIFDFQAYQTTLGRVIQGLDAMAVGYKRKNDLKYTALMRQWKQFHTDCVAWMKELKKIK